MQLKHYNNLLLKPSKDVSQLISPLSVAHWPVVIKVNSGLFLKHFDQFIIS